MSESAIVESVVDEVAEGKKRAGRPKKYTNVEEKKLARKEQNRIYQHTLRERRREEKKRLEEEAAAVKLRETPNAEAIRVMSEAIEWIVKNHGSVKAFTDGQSNWENVLEMEDEDHKYYMIVTKK